MLDVYIFCFYIRSSFLFLGMIRVRFGSEGEIRSEVIYGNKSDWRAVVWGEVFRLFYGLCDRKNKR